MRLSPELEAKCLELAGNPKPVNSMVIPLPEKSANAKSKYRSMCCTDLTGTLTFQSKKERDRYEILKAMAHDGDIRELVLQPRLKCFVNAELVCTYIADFCYRRGESLIYEDVKGFKTAVYKLKKRLVHACLGITIVES